MTEHRRRSPCCADEARRYLIAEGRQDATLEPFQWLHDNEFSWDDVNAIAAILDAGGFEILDEHGREVILEPARARIAELEARPVCEHLLGLPA